MNKPLYGAASGPRQRFVRLPWLIVALVFFTVAAARWVGWFEPAGTFLLDVLSLTVRDTGSSPHVAVVGFDEADIAEIGTFPFSDEIVATAARRILEQRPAALGLSFLRVAAVGTGRDQLLSVVRDHDNVYVIDPRLMSGDAKSLGLSEAAGAARAGGAFTLDDADEYVRTAFAGSLDTSSGTYRPTMKFLVAQRFLRERGIAVSLRADGSVALQDQIIPRLDARFGDYQTVPPESATVLVARRRDGAVPVFSVRDLLAGRIPAGTLQGKAVILATTAPSAVTRLPAVLGRRFLSPDILYAAGAVEAQEIDQIVSVALDGWRPLRSLNETTELALLAGWLLLTALLLQRQQALALLATTTALLIVAIATAAAALAAGWWIPLFPTLLVIVLMAAYSAARLLHSGSVLRRATAMMQAVIDRLPEPVYVLDARARVRIANQAFCRLAARLPQDIARRPLSDIFTRWEGAAASVTGGLRQYRVTDWLARDTALWVDEQRLAAREEVFTTALVRARETTSPDLFAAPDAAVALMLQSKFWAKKNNFHLHRITVALDVPSPPEALIVALGQRLQHAFPQAELMQKTAGGVLLVLAEPAAALSDDTQRRLDLALEWPLENDGVPVELRFTVHTQHVPVDA